MEAKKEAIKKAYGEYYDKVKKFIGEDGWCVRIDYSSGTEVVNHKSLNELGIFKNDDLVDVGYDHGRKQHIWRPKSLIGFKDNNGWTKIESESDLPKESGSYWVIDKILNTNPNQEFFDTNALVSMNERWMYRISHYQPIIKPAPPIY